MKLYSSLILFSLNKIEDKKTNYKISLLQNKREKTISISMLQSF